MFSVKSLSGKQFEKLFLRRRANPTPIRFLLPGIVGTFRKKKTIDSYAETVPPGTGLPRCPQEFGGSPPGKPGKCHGARPWGGGSGRMALASPRAGVLSFRPDSGHVEMNEHESCSLSALSCFCRAAGPRGSCPPRTPAALSHRYRDPHMLRCPPGSCGSRPHPSPICWTLGPTPKRATTWLRDSGHVA